jgi:hypothetical protein
VRIDPTIVDKAASRRDVGDRPARALSSSGIGPASAPPARINVRERSFSNPSDSGLSFRSMSPAIAVSRRAVPIPILFKARSRCPNSSNIDTAEPRPDAPK